MSKTITISSQNKCNGCPLADAPVGFKILNLCNKYRPGYRVKYGLDDFGYQICEVFKEKFKS